MGNIEANIKTYMTKLDLLISKEDYENIQKLFGKYIKELEKYNSEENRKEIIKLLIDYLEPDISEPLNIYMSNLKFKDKIYLLFKEIYESKLIELGKFQISESVNEEEIKQYIKKNENIFKKISLASSVYKLNETLSNLYFYLADIKYKKYTMNLKKTKEDISEIIDNMESCLKYIENSINKDQKESYNNFKQHLINEKKKLCGLECLNQKKYEEAINFFKEMNNSEENIKEYIDKCYILIAEEYEEKNDYANALLTLKKLNMQDPRIKTKEILINMKILYSKIENNFKEGNFFRCIDLYYSLLEYKIDKDLNRNYFLYYFEKYYFFFLSTLSKITLIYYKDNKIKDYIAKLEEYSNKYSNQKISNIIQDLINYLKTIEKDKSLLSLDYISDILSGNNEINEIVQRIYIIFLIEYYLIIDKEKVLNLLLNNKINLLYLTEESKLILNKFLEKEENLDILFLLVNIYIIITQKGIDCSLSLYKTIGKKIFKLFKNKPSKITKVYYETMKLLLIIFQNIISKSNYDLKDPIKIYSSLLFGIPELKKEIINGLIFLTKKNNTIKLDNNIIIIFIDYILSHNDIIDLLDIIIEQLKMEDKLDKNMISLLFTLLLYYKEEEFNLPKINQEKIIKFLKDINIEKEYLEFQITQFINEYLKLGGYSDLIFEIINKIPEENRSFDMNEAIHEFAINKKVQQGKKKKAIIKQDKYQLEIDLKMSNSLNPDKQAEIENNLEDQNILQIYIKHLKSNKELFKTINLEKISNYINLNSLELFILICENKKIWSNEALSNLLNGFYKGDNELIKQTFMIFSLIEKYQKLPEIILKNLEIEKKLSQDSYYHLPKEDRGIYKQMIIDFNQLNGFSGRHKNFIKQLDNFNYEDNDIIYNDLINLIVDKNFDIGKSPFYKSIKNINQNKFIQVFSKLLSNPKININYKTIILKRLDNELKKETTENNILISIIIQIKYFIEWLILPSTLINTFLSLLKKNNNGENTIKKEIIFSIGNYFSIQKDNQKELFIQFQNIIKDEEAYKVIKRSNTNPEFKDEDISYIYSNAQYYNVPALSKLDNIPIKVIIKFIYENQKNYRFEEIEEKINNFCAKFKSKDFCPERDRLLRQLFLNPSPKSLDYLKIII